MKRNSYQKKNWWYEKRDYVYNYEYKVSHDFLLSPTEAGAVCGYIILPFLYMP